MNAKRKNVLDSIYSTLITPRKMSPKFTLNREDFYKIGKGLLIALAGAALTYLASVIGDIDFGPYTPVIVALGSVLINAGLKFLQGK